VAEGNVLQFQCDAGAEGRPKNGEKSWQDRHRKRVVTRRVNSIISSCSEFPVGTYEATSLFKSEDAGKSWAEIWSTATPDAIPDVIDVGTLAVAPHDPNILYVGVDSSVARSVDGGHTWTKSQVALKQVPGACCVSAIAVNPQNSNIVYAGTFDDWDGGTGVWKSTDGGVNWVNLVPRGGVISIIMDPGNPNIIYVNGGAWTSMDGGQTWTIKSVGGVGAGAGCDLLAIDPHNSSILYCGDYGTNVFRSVDAGASWTEAGPGLSGRVSSLSLDPHDPGTLYATTTAGLFAITLEPAPASKRPRR
jgi:photosystem II stability/assembly factor-like uncharacterized protein